MPVPKEVGTLMLSIVRNKSGFNKWHPKYTLVAYLMDDRATTFEKEIIVGKKRSKNSKATYMISLDKKNPKASGDAYCGKVKLINKKLNNYVVFNYGVNPKKDRKPFWRKTLGDIYFKNQKYEKFGTVRTVTAFFVPLEGDFSPDGKYKDSLKFETPELIKIMPQNIQCEDQKPSLDKEKDKYVSYEIRLGLIPRLP